MHEGLKGSPGWVPLFHYLVFSRKLGRAFPDVDVADVGRDGHLGVSLADRAFNVRAILLVTRVTQFGVVRTETAVARRGVEMECGVTRHGEPNVAVIGGYLHVGKRLIRETDGDVTILALQVELATHAIELHILGLQVHGRRAD